MPGTAVNSPPSLGAGSGGGRHALNSQPKEQLCTNSSVQLLRTLPSSAHTLLGMHAAESVMVCVFQPDCAPRLSSASARKVLMPGVLQLVEESRDAPLATYPLVGTHSSMSVLGSQSIP